MSLNELVDMYNQKLNSNGTDVSQHTAPATLHASNGPDALAEAGNFSYTHSASSALLFDSDTSRFHLNDRVLAGEVVRPPAHNSQPRIERVKQADKLEFSTGEADIDDYEHNEEYTTKYPDIKPQLNIINAQQAHIPPVDMFTNPGEQIQRLIQQGKLKNFHG